MEELKTRDSKRKEVLDETEEIVINLKTHLEHAKEVEEALKILLTKKEELCHILKLEIVNFKKINEGTNADLMTQIEEANKKEVVQKIQITKKEESCKNFELESIKLKRIQREYEEEIKK